jgi:hypothetical protein
MKTTMKMRFHKGFYLFLGAVLKRSMIQQHNTKHMEILRMSVRNTPHTTHLHTHTHTPIPKIETQHIHNTQYTTPFFFFSFFCYVWTAIMRHESFIQFMPTRSTASTVCNKNIKAQLHTHTHKYIVMIRSYERGRAHG